MFSNLRSFAKSLGEAVNETVGIGAHNKKKDIRKNQQHHGRNGRAPAPGAHQTMRDGSQSVETPLQPRVVSKRRPAPARSTAKPAPKAPEEIVLMPSPAPQTPNNDVLMSMFSSSPASVRDATSTASESKQTPSHSNDQNGDKPTEKTQTVSGQDHGDAVEGMDAMNTEESTGTRGLRGTERAEGRDTQPTGGGAQERNDTHTPQTQRDSAEAHNTRTGHTDSESEAATEPHSSPDQQSLKTPEQSSSLQAHIPSVNSMLGVREAQLLKSQRLLVEAQQREEALQTELAERTQAHERKVARVTTYWKQRVKNMEGTYQKMQQEVKQLRSQSVSSAEVTVQLCGECADADAEVCKACAKATADKPTTTTSTDTTTDTTTTTASSSPVELTASSDHSGPLKVHFEYLGQSVGGSDELERLRKECRELKRAMAASTPQQDGSSTAKQSDSGLKSVISTFFAPTPAAPASDDARVRALRAEQQKMERLVTKLRTEGSQFAQQATSRQRELRTVRAQLRELQKSNDALKARVDTLEPLETKVKTQEETLVEMGTQLATLQQNKDNQQREMDLSHAKALRELRAAHGNEVAELKSAADTAAETLAAVQRELSLRKKDLTVLNEQCELLRGQHEEATKTQGTAQAQCDRYRQELQGARADFRELQAVIASLRSQTTANDEGLSRGEQDILTKQVRTLQQQMTRLTDQQDALGRTHTAETARYVRRISELEAETVRHQARADSVARELSSAQHEQMSAQAALRQELLAAESRAMKAESSVQALQDDVQRIRQQLESAQEQRSADQQALSTVRATGDRLRAQLSEQAASMIALRKENADLLAQEARRQVQRQEQEEEREERVRGASPDTLSGVHGSQGSGVLQAEGVSDPTATFRHFAEPEGSGGGMQTPAKHQSVDRETEYKLRQQVMTLQDQLSLLTTQHQSLSSQSADTEAQLRASLAVTRRQLAQTQEKSRGLAEQFAAAVAVVVEKDAIIDQLRSDQGSQK